MNLLRRLCLVGVLALVLWLSAKGDGECRLLYAGPQHLGDTTNPSWLTCDPAVPDTALGKCMEIPFTMTAVGDTCIVRFFSSGTLANTAEVYLDGILLGYLNPNVGGTCDFNVTDFVVFLTVGDHVLTVCATEIPGAGELDDFAFKDVRIKPGYCVVNAEASTSSTWGRIKSLYRNP